jgi:hypothetical protein
MTNKETIPNKKHIAVRTDAPALPVPAGHRIPYGWKTIAVDRLDSGRATRLEWEGLPYASSSDKAYFRITVASDVREEKKIEVRLARSGEAIGTFGRFSRFASRRSCCRRLPQKDCAFG